MRYKRNISFNGDLKNISKNPDGSPDFYKTKSNFEDAIKATGFGKFNILLLLFLIPSSFAQAFEQMGMSYVIPIAECDLKITIQQKGMLNAVSFAGMIASGVILGVVCDIFGRRKMIVYGFLLHSICVAVAALSQNFTTLMIAKFWCGFVFNGPFSACTTYLSEFHASEYRSRVQLFRGITFSLGFFLLPVVAWIILPLKINYSLFGVLDFHSWNLYLLFCIVGPLLAAIGFAFLPESPKFLMSNGQNKQAILVFQQVFNWNTGKLKAEYPVKDLAEEIKITNQNKKHAVKEAFTKFMFNIKPLFRSPLIFRLMLACSSAYIILMSGHILKLWLPQILQLTNDYHQSSDNSSFSICNMISTLSQKNTKLSSTCQVNMDNTSVYKNAMLISGPQILIFACSGFIVNYLGKTKLIAILCTTASICSMGLYFATNSSILITLFAIYIPFVDLVAVIIVTITLELFATHFRVVALSFHFMSARLGSLTANLLFSTLVGTGCLAPFLLCTILTAILSILTIFYPNTENKALE